MSEEPRALRDRRAVSSICSALHRAYRDTRFYPRDHPVALQSLDALARVLLRFVGDEGALTLTIEEGRLIYEEGEVYSHAETRDNLAFIMFRDGLRAITFQTGLEQPEIEALVDCLSRADEPSSPAGTCGRVPSMPCGKRCCAGWAKARSRIRKGWLLPRERSSR